MVTILRDLIGVVPKGYEFIEYIFAFLLVTLGLKILWNIIEIPLSFFRKKGGN